MSHSINEFSLHPKFHVLLGKIPKLNRSSPGGKFLSRLLQDVKLIFHVINFHSYVAIYLFYDG